ncbi:MAG: dihydroorotate dehydrogenase electron transfer subunit [Bacteroidales bacterium]|jgi:dihydroorotate dehydrogenase electron transfer subunit
MSKKLIHDFIVVENRPLNEAHFLLVLEAPAPMPDIQPGQFVEARIDGSPKTFLRRPLSIHDVDYRRNLLTLLVQQKGEGTRHLSRLSSGASLNLVYPLGNHFTLVENQDVLLVGGGCGVAPLLFLARRLFEKGNRITTLMGARSAEGIMEKEKFEAFGAVEITTEDGSMGTRGFVIHHNIWRKRPFAYPRIYTCGPDPMMRAVGRLAKIHDTSCEVSLEQTMACGLGACLVCVVKTNHGHVCTCTDGPVFNINDLTEWLEQNS